MSIELLKPVDPARQAWLEERKTYLGGTDLAKLMGVSKYGDALDVYLEKKGLAPEKDLAFYVELGNFLEPAVAQRHANATGLELRKGTAVRHPEFPFLGGNPDFLPLNTTAEGLEIKCVTYRALWTDEWGPDGSEQARLDYQVQVQWYMGLTGIHTFKLRAAFVDWDRAEKLKDLGMTPTQLLSAILEEERTYTIRFDQELFDLMVEKGKEFWIGYVVPNIEPAATAKTSSEAQAELLRLRSKGFKDEAAAGPEDEIAATAYALTVIRRKKAEEAEKNAKAKLTARVNQLGVKRLKGQGWQFGTVEPKEKEDEDTEAVIAELAARASVDAEALAKLRAKHTKKFTPNPYVQGWMTALEKKLAAATGAVA